MGLGLLLGDSRCTMASRYHGCSDPRRDLGGSPRWVCQGERSLFSLTHSSQAFLACDLPQNPISPPRSPSLTQWTSLNRRCSVAKETDEFILPWAFQRVFATTQCKAAFLLNTLPPSMQNTEDNLMTKLRTISRMSNIIRA